MIFSSAIRRQWYLLLSLVFFAGSSVQAEELVAQQVHLLLTGVSRALHEQSFDALVTYEHSGFLDSLRWQHSFADGKELAVLHHLNGPLGSSQMFQAGEGCLSLADRIIRGDLSPFGDRTITISESYRFIELGAERVAGRPATIFHVAPLDNYRFGYNLAIDQQSGLPLRIMTLSPDNRVLERFEVVELRPLEVPLAIDAAVQTLPMQCSPEVDAGQTRWRVGWTPSGFVLSSVAANTAAGDMLVFSDGFSTVSVFVQAGGLLQGGSARAQRGATNAYMEQMLFDGEPFLITVVGEIPVASASRMAASLQRQ